MAATTLGGNQEYGISETGKQLQGTKEILINTKCVNIT